VGRKLLCTSGRKVSPGVPHNRSLGLQTLLRDKFGTRAGNGNSVEEIWNNFKEIVSESIERFVPHKILRKTRTLNTTTRKLND
jgi:hypothetical protein